MSDTKPTEPGTDIALLPPAERALVVLKSTEAEKQLRELVARTEPISAPVDAAGREEVHRAAMDHKNARVAIEKAGKTAREDATAFSKAVIDEQKRLTAINADEEARLFELRDTYDTKVRQEKEEAERKERERVAAIREKIEGIKNLPVASAADDSVTLTDTLTDLREFEITFEDFAEFQDEANAVRTAAIAALENILNAALAREAAEAAAREAEAKLAAQREELARQQRELAEQQAEIARQRAELEAAKAAAAPAVVAGPNEPPPEVLGEIMPTDHPDFVATQLKAARETFPEMFGAVTGQAADANGVPADECAHDYLRPDGTCTECGTVCAFPAEPLLNASAGESVQLGTIPAGTVLADPQAVEASIAGLTEHYNPDAQVEVEMVTITRDEYDSLMTRSRWLECLEAAGVDNWEGIDEALRINREQVPA